MTDKKWHTKQSATILKRQKTSGNDVFFRGSYHKDVRRALSTNRCFLEVKSLIPWGKTEIFAPPDPIQCCFIKKKHVIMNMSKNFGQRWCICSRLLIVNKNMCWRSCHWTVASEWRSGVLVGVRWALSKNFRFLEVKSLFFRQHCMGSGGARSKIFRSGFMRNNRVNEKVSNFMLIWKCRGSFT